MKATGLLLLAALLIPARADNPGPTVEEATAIRCGNLVYSGGKSSKCFADAFLASAATATGIPVLKRFRDVKTDSDELFDSPFHVISGEGSFKFTEKDRENLRRYLTCGGFLVASPGCSDAEWDKSFRNEIKGVLPDAELVKIPMSHPLFSTVYQIPSLSLKGGGTTLIEGIEIDGRLVMIYSTEGLNDVANAQGCCCCGGNQIRESQRVNVNILMYALLH